jgi:hypothetical protein
MSWSILVALVKLKYASLDITKPSGTGRPIWNISPRLAPFPPAMATDDLLISENQ